MTSLAVPLDLVEQVAGQGRRRAPFFRHPRPARGLEAKDAVFPRDVAGDGDAALPRVGRGRATPGGGDGPAAVVQAVVGGDVLHGLRRGRGVGVERGLGRPAVALHGVRGRAVTAVEAAVSAEELVVRRVGLVARPAGQGVGHGECARHVWTFQGDGIRKQNPEFDTGAVMRSR